MLIRQIHTRAERIHLSPPTLRRLGNETRGFQPVVVAGQKWKRGEPKPAPILFPIRVGSEGHAQAQRPFGAVVAKILLFIFGLRKTIRKHIKTYQQMPN